MENAFGQPQSVIVLGGSSDIARALTKKLCAARARTVILVGRSEDRMDAAAAEAHEFGATKTGIVLFDAENISNARTTVAKSFELVDGRVDMVVVAVGLLGNQFMSENDPVLAGRIALVNFAWPAASLAEVRRLLVAQGSGRILVVTSVAAVRVRRNIYLYSSAKAGLDRLCIGLADSLEGTGVTLQIVRPGFVRTRMTKGDPEQPFASNPDEVAENIMIGVSSRDRVIWSPPILKYIFWILRLLPYPIWRKVMDR